MPLEIAISYFLQTVSVAVDDTTVFGPRSMACLSPIPPDFEEIAKNEGQYSSTKNKTHLHPTAYYVHTYNQHQIIIEDRW